MVSCQISVLETHSTCTFCSLCYSRQTSGGRLGVTDKEWFKHQDWNCQTKARDLNVGVPRQGMRWGHRIVNECWLCLSHISSFWSLEWFLQSPKLLLSQPLKPAFWVWGQHTPRHCIWGAVYSLPYALSMSWRCLLYWAAQGTSSKRCTWSYPVLFSWEMRWSCSTQPKLCQLGLIQNCGYQLLAKTQIKLWIGWKKNSYKTGSWPQFWCSRAINTQVTLCLWILNVWKIQAFCYA